MRNGIVILAVAVAGLASNSTVMADPIPDHLAGLLRPGDAEVQVGPSPNEWNPQAGQEVMITVIARPRGHLRVGSQRRVFVRYISPPSRCGASYATARGTIVGPLILSGVGPPPRVPPVDPRGLLGTVNSAGDVVATTGPHYRFKRPGKLRFCVWLGRRARTRIRPIDEDVVVQGRLFAAVLVHGGSYDFPNHERVASVATFPFRTVTTTLSSSEPGCPGNSTVSEFAQRYAIGGYYVGGGLDESGGFPCSPTTQTWSFSSLPSRHAAAQSLGTLTLTDAERAAPVSTSPIVHLGACALIDELGRTVAETMSYLQAIGCRAGRVVARPKPQLYGSPAHGEVYGLEVHGGIATLVPSGTTVDMVVNP